MFRILWVTTTLLASPAFAAETLQGQVLERGTKKPLANLGVFLLPLKLRVETDAQGAFRFEGLEAGNYEIVVTAVDYEKAQRSVLVPAADPVPVYLERTSGSAFEFVVTDKRKREESTQALAQESFLKMPGAGGDPVKAAQNLPGVNRSSGFSSQIILQGADPEDTRYQVAGHEVPLIFHFGGLSSVLFPESIDRVELSSAGYGVERGRALGGIVGLWPREPRGDRYRGVGFVDLFNAGALVEGPVGQDGAFLISARQSYIGAVLKAALKDNDSFALTSVPQYRDFTLLYSQKLSEKWELRVTNFYSRDTLEFLLAEPVEQDPNFRGSLSNLTQFYRVIPELRFRPNAIDEYRFSVGAGQDTIRIDSSTNYFRINNLALSTRGEWEREWITDEFATTLGWDNIYNFNDVDIRLPDFSRSGGVADPSGSGAPRVQKIHARSHELGLFIRNNWKPGAGSWTLKPNFRVDHFTETGEWILAPRPGVEYAVNEGLDLFASGGLYLQGPQNGQSDAVFGNPGIRASRGRHITTGFRQDLSPTSAVGWKWGGALYFKDIRNLIVESAESTVRDGQTIAENYSNRGRGEIFGSQWEVQYRSQAWLLGLNYSIGRSRRQEPPSGWTPSPYDQTHVLTMLGSFEASRKWSFSSRLRLVSGNPITPIAGSVFDSDGDVYRPVRGALYSERLATFFQLDLRIDRKWTFDTWIFSTYLDLQNVTNRRNVESLSYSFDYREKRETTGLPFYPILGFKGEF